MSTASTSSPLTVPEPLNFTFWTSSTALFLGVWVNVVAGTEAVSFTTVVVVPAASDPPVILTLTTPGTLVSTVPVNPPTTVPLVTVKNCVSYTIWKVAAVTAVPPVGTVMDTGTPFVELLGMLTAWPNPRATYGALTDAVVPVAPVVKVLLKLVPAVVPLPAKAWVRVSTNGAPNPPPEAPDRAAVYWVLA